MPDKRIGYFDTLRGLAIIGVIAIHSSNSGLLLPEESANFNFTVLWRNLLNFSVPLFLAISGFFLAKKKVNDIRHYLIFVKTQIPRVYLPLIFWSFAWLILAVFIKNESTTKEIFKLITFQSSGPYYFIALIIQYYLLLPILNHLSNKKGLIITTIISISSTIIIFYFRYYTDTTLPLIVYAGNFITWGMFFVLGMLLGSNINIKFSNKRLIILIAISYIASCIESFALISEFHQAGPAVTAVKPSSFIYSLLVITLLFKNKNLIRSKTLKSIGDISFGIYLIHGFTLIIISSIISHTIPALQEHNIIYQLTLICTITASCFILISIPNKVLTNRISKIIGFK